MSLYVGTYNLGRALVHIFVQVKTSGMSLSDGRKQKGGGGIRFVKTIETIKSRPPAPSGRWGQKAFDVKNGCTGGVEVWCDPFVVCEGITKLS